MPRQEKQHRNEGCGYDLWQHPLKMDTVRLVKHYVVSLSGTGLYFLYDKVSCTHAPDLIFYIPVWC